MTERCWFLLQRRRLAPILAMLLLSLMFAQTARAQSVETGTGYFVCNNTSTTSPFVPLPCTPGQLVPIPDCQPMPTNGVSPPVPCPSPSAMTIWLGERASAAPGGAQSLSLLMVYTVEISTSSPNVPQTNFEVEAFSGASLSSAADLIAPTPTAGIQSDQRSFATFGSWIVINPTCPSLPGGDQCIPNAPLIPWGTVFRVDWQIEDPPTGSSDQSSFSLPLLALFAIPLVGVAYVGYRAGKRRQTHLSKLTIAEEP
jgi:hypothetical protein